MRTPLVVPLAIGGFFGVLAALLPVSDSDFFWHLANGDQTLRDGLARTDVFSWSIAGRPVLVDQWLGDALIGLAYAVGSWRGVVGLRALAVFALVALTVHAALAAAPQRPLLAVLASLPAIALSRFVWTDRPELFGYVAFVALIGLLRDGRDRALALAVPLLAIWANLHGSYALGLALVLALCAERALAVPGRRPRLAAVAVAATLATLLTPSGIATWSASGGHFLAPPRFIEEETAPDLRSFPGMIFAATLTLVMIGAFFSRKAGLREAIILVPVAFVSLTATRHMPFLAIAAAPFLAARAVELLAAITPMFRRLTPRDEARLVPGRRAEWLAALGAVAAISLALVSSGDNLDERAYPTAALASLPAGAGLLNSYDWGGWLIWRAGATPVFIDGRLFPYLPDALEDYRAVVGVHGNWQEVIARRDIRTLLLRPTDAGAVRARELGWRVLSSSESYVLLARP